MTRDDVKAAIAECRACFSAASCPPRTDCDGCRERAALAALERVYKLADEIAADGVLPACAAECDDDEADPSVRGCDSCDLNSGVDWRALAARIRAALEGKP